MAKKKAEAVKKDSISKGLAKLLKHELLGLKNDAGNTAEVERIEKYIDDLTK